MELKIIQIMNRTSFIRSASYYLHSASMTLIILNSTSENYVNYISQLVPEVFRSLSVPLILFTQQINIKYQMNGKNTYLIISEDLSTLHYFLVKYPQSISNPTDTFLILIAFPSYDNITEYQKVFDIFWKDRKLLDIMIFVKFIHKEDTEIILTYNPFQGDSLSKENLWTVPE